NLPDECIVEVPCHVDRNGIQPVRVGRIPSQLSAVMNLSVSVQQIAVRIDQVVDKVPDLVWRQFRRRMRIEKSGLVDALAVSFKSRL
ncbi:hypothetical protein ACC699_38810, partial [Rhizobium ruizarguesonis]